MEAVRPVYNRLAAGDFEPVEPARPSQGQAMAAAYRNDRIT
jgi:hypothetical protein